MWNRESEEAGRAPSLAAPSTVQSQSPATVPSPGHSVHSLDLPPNRIDHEPDEPETLNHEPKAQDFRSIGRFPAGTNSSLTSGLVNLATSEIPVPCRTRMDGYVNLDLTFFPI